jgi:ketosteroid isomerase-like protein
MDHPHPVEVVLAFVKHINEHQVDSLCALMAEDHVFVDSLGETYRGRETLRASWREYFALFPDYVICYTDLLSQGDLVVMLGVAQGTYFVNERMLEENKWQIPAAWKGVVRQGLLTEWRVYADNDPVRQVMAAPKG